MSKPVNWNVSRNFLTPKKVDPMQWAVEVEERQRAAARRSAAERMGISPKNWCGPDKFKMGSHGR